MRISGNMALAAVNEAATTPNQALVPYLERTALDHLAVVRAHCADIQPFAGLARAYVRELESQIAVMRGS